MNKYPLFFAFLTFLIALTSPVFGKRLVCVGGPVTEIVFALGFGDSVVAVDSSSMYPEEVQSLPQAGYVAAISAEGLLAMEPDLILASSRIGPPAVVEQLNATEVPMVVVDNPNSRETLKLALEIVGEKLGAEDRASALWKSIDSDLNRASEFATETEPIRAVFLLGNNGVALAAGGDTMGGGIIELAGGTNVFSSFKSYKAVSEEALISANPDVILIGSHRAAPGADARSYLERISLANISETSMASVHLIDMSEYLAFGPRVGQAALKLAQLFREVSLAKSLE